MWLFIFPQNYSTHLDLYDFLYMKFYLLHCEDTTLTFYFNYNTIHVTTAAFNTQIGKDAGCLCAIPCFYFKCSYLQKKEKTLTAREQKEKEKKKRQTKAAAFREVEGLSQKSLIGSFKHI